jgi:hypothetical protein
MLLLYVVVGSCVLDVTGTSTGIVEPVIIAWLFGSRAPVVVYILVSLYSKKDSDSNGTL